MSASTSPRPDPSTADLPKAGCPRCGQPLIDPTGLGWCKACGYCHNLADTSIEKKAPAPAEAPMPAAAGKRADAEASSSRSYAWVIIMAANIVLLAAATYAVHRLVPLKPFQRALWTTIQSVAGILLLFAGQFVGVLRLAPEEPSLGFSDVLMPTKIYPLILDRLPATRWALYLCSWGLTLAVSALTFLGGLGHWFTYLTQK